MKRFGVILLSALLCLALAACAADGPDGAGLCLADEGGDLSTAPLSLSPDAAQEEAENIPLSPASSWAVTEDITLSLLQSSYPVGTEHLTMVLENRGTQVMLYGQGWSYEKYVDGQWQAVETIEDYGFDAVGYILQPGQTAAFSIGAWFLAQPLEAGYYRVTGCALRVAADEEDLSYGGNYTDYPAYQLEFLVTEDAQPEPDYALTVLPSDGGSLLRILLHNTTGQDASILLIPSLERENDDGTWGEVPYAQGVGFCGTPDPLPAGSRNWSEETDMLWGPLSNGRYRLSYTVTDSTGSEYTASGEFTIDNALCALPTADTGE